MSRSTSLLRTAALVGSLSCTLAVALPALPAQAATPPAAPSAATATVGDRFLDLSWSGGGGTGAVVREVTGQPTPYTVTTGRAVTPTSPTSAHDTGFTNTATTATYAIWTTEADGTPSDTPLLKDVPKAPLVATSLTLATSVAAVPYGRLVGFTGTLTRAGTPVAGQPIELWARTGGYHDLRLLRRFTTGADGVARTSLPPTRSTDFSLRFVGDAFSAASESNHKSVLVLPRVSLGIAPAAIVRGESTVLSGRVTPTLAGAGMRLQRRIGSTWHDAGGLRVASTGTYRLVLTPALGLYTYRTVLTGTAAWMQALSPAMALRVDARDLAAGMRGDDVLALQHRLAVLHYEPGRIDGAFGYDVTHAVMAFQKVERLPITGRWTRLERARSGRPTAWRLRYVAPGRAVEIDITRQVLVLSEAGRVVKIIDVSTGSGKPYTSEGHNYVANTPRGRFSITRKIDGIRVSVLGELYRPSYFVGGYAIHGSPSVPGYPASHGCVRVTNPNADRLFPLLVKGTPVALYDE